MFGIRTRMLAAAAVATLSSPVALMAQWGIGNDCSCYTPQYVAAQAPIVTQSCQCLQPVTQMVSQQMQVTEYKAAQRVEKRPVTKMRMVSRPVTAYRQVMETKTVEVPVTSYQTVTEMRTQMVNKGRWQTVSQPVPKMAPCQYDGRPGMLGSMNRMGYQMRSAFQPNFVTHRQFVPQVCQCNVPVQRQVAVQSTRTQTYQVAKMVPYETTQQVAEAYTDYENVTVTTMEPVTVMKTVQVPVTRMAMVDPYTGMAVAPLETQTAKEPTPAARSAENDEPAPAGGLHKGISYPKSVEPAPASDRNVIRRDTATPKSKAVAKSSARPTATVATRETGGWKPLAPAKGDLPLVKTVKGKSNVATK